MTNLIERLRERVASPFERPAVDQALMSEAATALSEALEEVKREKQWRQQLQHALSYWMPGVNEETDSGHRKAGDDAYLLAAMEGDVDDRSWGNNIIAQRDEARAENERLTRERDEAVRVATNVSRALTSLTPGGSEYHSHSRILDAYFADTEACVAVVRERYASGHKAKLELVGARAALNPKGGDNGEG